MRLFAVVLALSMSVLANAAPPTDAELPNALKDWRAWVLHDEEYRDCPARIGEDQDEADDFVCAWPSELRIEATADGARFNQSWQVYARSFVPLPGDHEHQPLSVQVNDSAAPVVLNEGQPGLWLDAGNYQISGRLAWVDRPESIMIPEQVARIALSVDGKEIFPLNREADQLWLGRAESASVEADALSLQVFRLLSDGIPANLATKLIFEVSGKGREEVLPPPLPAGFEPTHLVGELPARIEGDGKLHVQVRPGSFSITLHARATAPLAEVSQGERATPWPSQEVWSYAPNGNLRVTEASGPPPIDPNIAEVPPEWRNFPAFMLEGANTLKVTENSRGLASADQNRLNLSRQLWLDFDGLGWTAKDQINGEMRKDWRLDVSAPLTLGRATENGEPSLITRSLRTKALGVEVRNRNLNLATTARVESKTRSLPVAGWNHTFDNVSTTLQVPPGYRLWAALGVDRAPEAWLDRWDLLDVFFAVLAVVLFAVCFGRLGALIPLLYLALAWHEPDAPRFALIFALAWLAIAKAVSGEGRFARFLGWLAKLSAILVLLFAVPFSIQQIRYGLYPQLLGPMYTGGFEANMIAGRMAANAPMEQAEYAQDAAQAVQEEPAPVLAAPAAPPAPVPQSSADKLERILVTGSRVQRADIEMAPRKKMRRYESNAVVYQNGYAEPSWNFQGYSLQIQGPVEAEQNMRLIITPPWLTALLRFLLVAALVWTVLAMLLKSFRSGTPSKRLGLGVVLLAAGFAAQASEPPTPSAEILRQLGERLREAPDCAPDCARLAEAEVSVNGERFTIALNLQASARVAVNLPGNENLLALSTVTLDGEPVGNLVRGIDGFAWMMIGRGVHRVEISGRIANAASVEIQFPMTPAWIEFQGEGWEASGIEDGRLSTGSLNLTRTLNGENSAVDDSGVAQRFAPFVRVTRVLNFDMDWSVETWVQRLAPSEGAFSIELPLLDGERVLSADLKVQEGRITVPFAEGADSVYWESRLDTVPSLTLVAPALSDRAEVWQLRASPTWNVMASGLPGVHPGDNETLFEYHPLPEERLTVQVTRPEAIPGGTIAFDVVNLQSRYAKRSVEHELDLQWRATQGGQHGLVLPDKAEVLSVSVNGTMMNLRPEKGVLRVPVTPGTGNIKVTWREVGEGASLRMLTPKVDLKAPASNISLGLNVPGDRWVIAASGPRLGPAVLYWGELIAMVLIAFALSRRTHSSLKLHDWLLLGVGFSTVSWFALFIFAGWLYLIDWRKRLNPAGWYWRFDLLQMFFVALTLAALIALFVALQTGLIGQPDLHVISRGYGANDLKWFDDLSESWLPQGQVITLPIWIYRALMLAWAFWMAWSLVRWGKAALHAFMHEGVWQPLFAPRAAKQPPAMPPVAGDTAANKEVDAATPDAGQSKADAAETSEASAPAQAELPIANADSPSDSSD